MRRSLVSLSILLVISTSSPAAAVEPLFEHLDRWLEDCEQVLDADRGTRECPFERVRGIDELPISDAARQSVRTLLDEQPVTADTGVVRALGVADTIPYDFFGSAAPPAVAYDEYEWADGPKSVLVVVSSFDDEDHLALWTTRILIMDDEWGDEEE